MERTKDHVSAKDTKIETRRHDRRKEERTGRTESLPPAPAGLDRAGEVLQAVATWLLASLLPGPLLLGGLHLVSPGNPEGIWQRLL